MSITDSSTTLDTSWAEQSIAEFTSGILTNEAACVTEVESKLKRGTLGASSTPTDTQVKNWLARAKMELAEVKNYTFTRKYASATLTAGTYRASLPNDYNGGLIVNDTTNDRNIDVVGRDIFDRRFPDMSAENQAEPIVACVKNMELWVGPPVNASTVLEIDYLRSGAATTASDFAWLPELERFRCCDFAIAMSFESLHQFDLADRYLARWGQDLGKSLKADGRRKWTARVSCINVFQDYALRSYQSRKT